MSYEDIMTDGTQTIWMTEGCTFPKMFKSLYTDTSLAICNDVITFY